MTQVKLEDLKKQGINEGCLVEIILKEGAKPNLRTTALVSYYGPEVDTGRPSTVNYSGYIKCIKIEKDQEVIALFHGWDNQNKQIPQDARIGGVYIYLDAIYSCVKPKK
ncbi:hypothetical protein COY26_02340 [Candidatus Woesearchaeota archaeon CG_4_10_14_0_2_um_filter_33_10]|nr:MAG: hypothetical protein COV14_01410 [Candidatus Woesearchaeota archaeon CG10_big_fil_rev_8_21_14_0_10_33_12]PIU72599.1 MAG: hypothetical protein COS79_01990 [Candidatus Woesearchaeota archaeon CG06_land_8_20_14_3_00_33_13]PIZ53291.1 MAG: hypothetical protein COY26_02340 [Candidatus Woesearchaeota archaeon CG_4_10_14_0_2_um_filter_33_10]